MGIYREGDRIALAHIQNLDFRDALLPLQRTVSRKPPLGIEGLVAVVDEAHWVKWRPKFSRVQGTDMRRCVGFQADAGHDEGMVIMKYLLESSGSGRPQRYGSLSMRGVLAEKGEPRDINNIPAVIHSVSVFGRSILFRGIIRPNGHEFHTLLLRPEKGAALKYTYSFDDPALFMPARGRWPVRGFDFAGKPDQSMISAMIDKKLESGEYVLVKETATNFY